MWELPQLLEKENLEPLWGALSHVHPSFCTLQSVQSLPGTSAGSCAVPMPGLKTSTGDTRIFLLLSESHPGSQSPL